MMVEITTVKISKRTKKELDRLKVHPREPYEDVIRRLIFPPKSFKRQKGE